MTLSGVVKATRQAVSYLVTSEMRPADAAFRSRLILPTFLLEGPPIKPSLPITNRTLVSLTVQSNGMECLLFTACGGLAIGAVLTWWLRSGAPTSPHRAGLLVGLASGSFAALAYGLHCPHNDLVYIGLWYRLAVALVALLGRIAVPPLIRW